MIRTVITCVFFSSFVFIEFASAQQQSPCVQPGLSGFAAAGQYVWTYRATDGMVCIGQIDSFGQGFSPLSQKKWDTGFSSFVGFSLAGIPYVWAYRASDGIVTIHQVQANGFTQKSLIKWDKGFSGFAATSVAGVVYIWAYRDKDGIVCIHKINAQGQGFTQVSMTKWDTGFASFVQAGPGIIWAYRSSDGTTTIHQLGVGGNGFTQKYYYKWDTGFSSFVSASFSGGPYVWAYRAKDGMVCIHRISPAGNGFTQASQYKWDTDFSGFVANNDFVLAYRTRGPKDSLICIHQIKPLGAGFTQTFYKPYYCSWQRRSGWVGNDDFRVELILDMDGGSLLISSRSQGKHFGIWFDEGDTASYSGSFSGPAAPVQPVQPNPFTLSGSNVPASFYQFYDYSTCFIMDHGKYTLEALTAGKNLTATVEW